MVLGRMIETPDGETHAMAGLLSHATSFAKRRLHLGYRHLTLAGDCVLGAPGTQIRGHEFHYASIIEDGSDEPLAQARDAYGNDLGGFGARRERVTGSFFHAIAQVA